MSCGITYNEYSACNLPENGPYSEVVLLHDNDMDDSSTTLASEKNSIKNTDSYLSLPKS